MSEFAVWTRLDRPGRDAALLQAHAGGWLLRGAAAFEHELGSAVVAYEVQLDARLETTRGALSGFLGDASVRHEILRDESGWRLNGARVDGLERLVDLDYGFTPATNILQLMRMALPLGGKAELPVAWFDLDSAALTELPQIYERRGDAAYWYEAPTVPVSGSPGNRRRTGSSVPIRVFGALSSEIVSPATRSPHNQYAELTPRQPDFHSDASRQCGAPHGGGS